VYSAQGKGEELSTQKRGGKKTPKEIMPKKDALGMRKKKKTRMIAIGPTGTSPTRKKHRSI